MPFFSTFTHFTPYELYKYIEENTDDDFIGWTHHVMRSDYSSGIYTSKLDRFHILKALKTRSAYATNWINRHYIDFTINGLPVGENDSTVVVEQKDSTRLLDLTIAADGVSLEPDNPTEISKIQIFKNSELWNEWTDINAPIKRILINDTADITGTSYDHCIQKDDGNWYIHERSIRPVDPDSLNTGGEDYYYVRMIDSNPIRPGIAWCGPIWVKSKN